MRKLMIPAAIAAAALLAPAPAGAFAPAQPALAAAGTAVSDTILVKRKVKARPRGWNRGNKPWRGGLPPGQRKKLRRY
ncbi:MAG TPA: hypothetical protein VHG27_09035 [Xanthobacteraceae bacterium]|nr:hypothetical protein [Xanthobacteraceae bacterium]